MFGGQDDNAQAPQTSGSTSDDTLNGVNDLVGGVPAPADGGNSEDATPVSPPQEPASTNNGPIATQSSPDDTDALLDLKQQALQQLTPLVGHLDQSPVDKFRTTMMLIQASDNKSLLREAYQAAQAIEDQKIRAQALLDVVNEINYFTQNSQQQ